MAKMVDMADAVLALRGFSDMGERAVLEGYADWLRARSRAVTPGRRKGSAAWKDTHDPRVLALLADGAYRLERGRIAGMKHVGQRAHGKVTHPVVVVARLLEARWKRAGDRRVERAVRVLEALYSDQPSVRFKGSRIRALVDDVLVNRVKADLWAAVAASVGDQNRAVSEALFLLMGAKGRTDSGLFLTQTVVAGLGHRWEQRFYAAMQEACPWLSVRTLLHAAWLVAQDEAAKARAIAA